MRTTTKARLDSIDADLESFLQLLGNYSHEQLNRSASDGGWSAMQCLQHLMASEKGSLAYLRKKLSYDPKLPKAGFLSRFKILVLLGYNRLPIKFKAPDFIATDKLPPQSDLETTAVAYRTLRQEIRTYLEELDPKWYDRQVFKHPLAGRLSLNQMLSFFGGHMSRHRRQAIKCLAEQ